MSNNDNTQAPEICDVAPPDSDLDGDRVQISDILRRPLLVTGWRTPESTMHEGQYLILQFKLLDVAGADAEKLYIVMTSGVGLRNQLAKYADANGGEQRPFRAAIELKSGQQGRTYYIFCKSSQFAGDAPAPRNHAAPAATAPASRAPSPAGRGRAAAAPAPSGRESDIPF